MSYRLFTLAALATAALATPALAAPQTAPAQAAQPAPKAAPVPTRAGMAQNVEGTFKAFDSNKDNFLSTDELAAAETRIVQQRLAQIRTRFEGDFTKLDTNKDGSLSKAEFMAAAPSDATAKPDGTVILGKLDTNKDGKVNAAEFAAPQLAAFDRLDTNKDGQLSPEERRAVTPR